MKNTILVVLTLVATMVAMVIGGTTVDAAAKTTPLQEAQRSARTLYGVQNAIDKGKGEQRAEQVFMAQFKKQGQLYMDIKDKKMKKVVKKLDKVIIKARVNFNAGKKQDALKTINTWVEKDYKKAIDTLYKN